MNQYELIAPCHFGLEALTKREVQDLGYSIVKVEDGKVMFTGGKDVISRANIFMRTPERILLKVGQFTAETFDELFEGIKSLPWEKFIPKNGKFWVAKATSIKSKLFSTTDIQSVCKKAMVDRLKSVYHMEWFPENGADYPVRITIIKNEVTIGLDTSGVALHKRGYRQLTSKAPISETLAAALIMLTPWKADRPLIDPFCGSGTIPIEAALIGANIAPGLHRSFTAENWQNIAPKKIWYEAVEEADSLIRRDVEMNIQGFDRDADILKAARENAKMAGVDSYIHFQQRELRELHSPKKYGFIITNPPYGERLEDKKKMPELYRTIGQVFGSLETWSYFLISGYEDAQKEIGRKADRNRKIYNGMMKTYFYQYMGPKPPFQGKRKSDER